MNQLVSISEQAIHQLIDFLVRLLQKGKIFSDKIKKCEDKIRRLDESNPDYAEVSHDRKENMKVGWRVLIFFLSVGLDFLLLINSMQILCELFNLPIILKYAVPVALVTLEVAISYFQILRQRQGERTPWFARNLQYFVITILVALCILVIIFTISSYNPNVDGNFWAFLLGTLIVQIGLLLGSIMLHVWIIRNSEDIAESFAFLIYKVERTILSNRAEKLKKKERHNVTTEFIQESQRLIRKTDQFHRNYPNSNIDFEKSMPDDLIKAINRVMGKQVFGKNAQAEYVDAEEV